MTANNDLRDYVDVLIRRWKLVLAMPVLAILAAALASLAVKPEFEATAVIALAPSTLSIPTANQVPPYYIIVDSPRRLPVAYTPSYYISILKGADVVNAVSPRTAVSITSNGSDKSLIEITARSGNAQEAAATANRWAEVGAGRILQTILPSGDEARAAQEKLDGAEQALVKFSQQNGLEYNIDRLRSTTLPVDKRQELDRLTRARDTAEAVYNEFARDLERSNILATNAYKPSTIPAPVPSAPVSANLPRNLLIAAGFGLLIGVLGAFAAEYMVRKR